MMRMYLWKPRLFLEGIGTPYDEDESMQASVIPGRYRRTV